MIVFLDFDGVLHPGTAKESLFCHRDIFENWLSENKSVSVVISSSWREALSLTELREVFREEFQSRIISKCLNSSKNTSIEYARYEEILQWIYYNDYQGQWVAIDDAANEFPPNFPKLILTDSNVGLTTELLDQVTAKLWRIQV